VQGDRAVADLIASSPVGPTLLTERLILRPTAAEDFDAYAAFMADPATRYIGGPQVRSAAWRGFASVAGAWALQGYSMFSVIERSSGRWIGRVGPWVPEGWPGTEVGWGVIPEVFGNGYAFEAAVATIDWAFDHLGWTDVIHCIDPDNAASRRLAERLGSVNRGPGKLPPPVDAYPVDIWGQSREAWSARRRA
jgi:RimJ/RimL family protein N-acetyltransferase